MTTKTIDLQGKRYSLVKDRLQEFRSANPKGLIDTNPIFNPDGSILFKARILKDKEDITSAEATGHALGLNKGLKAFEKLETIAVGRALALLGYASDGEIASSDEMEEFQEYQETKQENMIASARESLESVGNMEELKTCWASIPTEAKKILEEVKEKMKKQYENK